MSHVSEMQRRQGQSDTCLICLQLTCYYSGMESNHIRHTALTLHRIHFLLDRLGDQVLQEKHRITFSQFMTLFAIKHCGEVSQRHVADFQNITEAAVSRHIEKLRKSGLLNRIENPHNRREHILTLTEAGVRIADEAIETLDTNLKTVFQALSATEKQRLGQALETILDTMCNEYGNTICYPSRKRSKTDPLKGDT